MVTALVAGPAPWTAQTVLTQWRLDIPLLTALAVAAAVYLCGVVRVDRRHPARRWPAGRTLAYLTGLATVWAALSSFVGIYATTFFWIHMIQHLLLIMVAPALLVVGRPLILVMHASRNPWHTRVKRLLRSRPVTIVTCPAVSVPIYAATVVGTHLTAFQNVAVTHSAAAMAEIALYLIAGYLYFLPSIGDEPIRWRLSAPAKMVAVLLIMPIDTFTGVALLMTTHAPWPAYAAQHRGWGPDPLTDVHWGGAVMWIGGDTIMIVLIVLALCRWLFGNARSRGGLRWIEQVRRATLDQRLATAGRSAAGRGDPDDDDERLAAYNSWLAELAQQDAHHR